MPEVSDGISETAFAEMSNHWGMSHEIHLNLYVSLQ